MAGTCSFVLTLTVVILICVTSIDAMLDCDSHEERADAYANCFNDRGLKAPSVFDTYRKAATDDNHIDMGSLFEDQSTEYCTNRRTMFKAAVRCVYHIDTECVDATRRLAMPTPGMMDAALEALCNDVQNIEFGCAKRQGAASESCIVDKATKVPNIPDENKMICKTLSVSAECAKETYKKCGCATSRVYSNIIYDLMRPYSCSETKRVVCSATDAQKFVHDDSNSGASVRLHFVMSPLAISFILVIAIVVEIE